MIVFIFFLFLKILLAWFIADFITGLIHWFEDKYLEKKDGSILSTIAEYNELHHTKPTAMLLNSWWDNIKQSVYYAVPISTVMLLLGFPFVLWLAVLLSSLGNLIHRWAHTPKDQLNKFVLFMQSTGLFITCDEHILHHKSMLKLIPKQLAGYKFCTITIYLNYLLDLIKFWDWMEYSLAQMGFYTIKMKESE